MSPLREQQPPLPEISVVIALDWLHPVLSEELRGFISQTVPASAFELIVTAWEHSPDLTAQIERFKAENPGGPALTYVKHSRKGRAALNNLGLSLARAPLVCFLANDYIPFPGLIEAYLAFHRAHPEPCQVGIGAGNSPSSQREASPILAWLEDSGMLSGVCFRAETPRLPPAYFSVANASAHKDFLLAHGGFDERLEYPCLDDADLAKRLARSTFQSTFVPGATAIHDHPITLSERCWQLHRAGLTKGMLEARRRSLWPRTSQNKPAAALSAEEARALRRQHGTWRPRLWFFALGSAYMTGYLLARLRYAVSEKIPVPQYMSAPIR